MFSSDGETSALIRQVLATLAIEEESCSEAVAAAQLIAQQGYQFVIIDWNQQPEAGLLLSAGRERKASERPLTLAIVSDDAGVPKALQAGANSVLRRPLQLNQVKDTLTTARDLLRARQESAAAAAAAAPPAKLPSSVVQTAERTLRAGEFLQPSASSSATQFDTESDFQKSIERSAVGEVDPLKELEPMAASVTPEPAPPPPPPDEPRGLQWFLNRRAATLPPVPAQVPTPPATSNPELLGFDQMAASTPAPQPPQADPQPEPAEAVPQQTVSREQKGEAELFAYITEGAQPEEKARSSFHIGKGAIISAVTLAACAIAAAPQAPWNPVLRALWGREQQGLHAWLNPQPLTPVQAPESHENFGRAGDEYKLPVAETIPDATTDPSQIRVTPVVDPTAKKNNSAATNSDPAAVSPDAASPVAGEQPAPEIQVKETTVGSAPSGTSDSSANNLPQVSQAPSAPPAVVAAAQPQPDVPGNLPVPTPAPPRTPQVRPVSNVATPPIPTSLKSQMASMTPDASGNKPLEAALPSIEPVKLPESAERTLLVDQPALAYPSNAKGQRGTVILEVLVGRDGTVEDAKFLQGSLAFARAAIDGAKQWKFKPYIMNGRPVSVQTLLTITFDPKP